MTHYADKDRCSVGGDGYDTVQCEVCGEYIPLPEANTKTVDGGKGNTETLAFCERCSE